ncbi:MAG: AAA family ATPase, partial [Bacteroidaceae bacterium]|nr:AAA family ATPase [Bacteroidaceae bacterium]
MLKLYFEQQIKEFFPYKPTFEQEKTLNCLLDFYLEAAEKGALVLKGYAGTGKTTLMSAFVQTLVKLKQKVVLLAPTGRAAKVFASYAGQPTFTIHKKIYREQSF